MRWPIAASICLLLFVPATAAPEVADLAIALAVDASGSVDDEEYRLQVEGIAFGFRDQGVRNAIRSGPSHRIAVNLVVWAEPSVPKDMSGWYLIESDADADRFADLVASFPRRVTGATGIGEGIAGALRSFDGNGITASREVVDVSGDGRETPPREMTVLMPQARAMALARGVTLNGLAILNEDPGLAEWYRRWVQAGTGSFTMSVSRYEDFAEAMRRKLIREIEYRPRLSDVQ